MRIFKRAVALACLVLLGFTPVAEARNGLPRDYAAWSRVADCESGGWRVLGAAYPDPLGITRGNYEAFGGHPLPPGPVSVVERVVVIRVADRLIARYHMGIPDQHGCAAW